MDDDERAEYDAQIEALRAELAPIYAAMVADLGPDQAREEMRYWLTGMAWEHEKR